MYFVKNECMVCDEGNLRNGYVRDDCHFDGVSCVQRQEKLRVIIQV